MYDISHVLDVNHGYIPLHATTTARVGARVWTQIPNHPLFCDTSTLPTVLAFSFAQSVVLSFLLQQSLLPVASACERLVE